MVARVTVRTTSNTPGVDLILPSPPLAAPSSTHPCVQNADVHGCAPVQQLSALKEELESAQSPIMRKVFSWLFPFGPGWNSGT